MLTQRNINEKYIIMRATNLVLWIKEKRAVNVVSIRAEVKYVLYEAVNEGGSGACQYTVCHFTSEGDLAAALFDFI